MSEILLEAVGVKKSYGKGHTFVSVLEDTSLAVEEGQMLAVLGTSGAGKSTLLHVLGGIDTPDAGKVLYRGEDINTIWAGRRDLVRNRLFGFVFQFYHLLREFTALENVLMPQMIREGVLGWPGKRRDARRHAEELLGRFGLSGRLHHRPWELSGGEQQRVAIARALVAEPKVLLCDEPTGNLDAKTGREIVDILMNLNRAGQTMVVVTHDRELAELAHRQVTLAEGKVRPGK